jgi:diguanylate cyclase (GGDEF)-like protein
MPAKRWWLLGGLVLLGAAGLQVVLERSGVALDVAEVCLLAGGGIAGAVAVRLGARLSAERRRHLAALSDQASRDPLTGLASRAVLNRELEERPGVLLLIDLDGFKAVNDTLGHDSGDQLLTVVGSRISAIVPRAALAARLGGDEFAVLLPAGTTRPEAVAVAEQVMATLTDPITLDGMEPVIGASIGVAFPESGAGTRQLLRDADIALYAAKAAGRACYRIFEPGMHAETLARVQLENDLAHALIRDEFEVAYQPIVDLPDGRVTGFEALLRWRHPTRGLLGPGAFLPAAEQAGLLPACDRWILATACRQLAIWRYRHRDLTVSVNISAGYLTDGTLAADVQAALTAAALPPAALTLEITESALVTDLDRAAEVLRQVKALGVRVALDDFGTGYSSLAYMRALPIDILKIDRSFVADLNTSDTESTLTGAILALAHSLKLGQIAEGVEDAAQAQWLSQHDCRQAQGYHFARPMPADRITALLDSGARCAPYPVDTPAAPRIAA